MQSKAVGTGAMLALGLMLTCASAHAADVVGVAFVHGTGKQTDARTDYWQPGIIDSVRQGLPNSGNYTVINCDFEQYMWKPEAAGCLATQLTSFINSKGITSLVVITHSNGGNVVRWMLSNPTYDSRYPKLIQTISKVTALAPSSAGTPLADAVLNGNVFEASVGWLLGYQNADVRMQQVGWMATNNAQHLYGTAGRPALPFLGGRLRDLRRGSRRATAVLRAGVSGPPRRPCARSASRSRRTSPRPRRAPGSPSPSRRRSSTCPR